MQNWFIDATTGLQITVQTGGWFVASPGRQILHYEANEVEHVVLHGHTRATVLPVRG